MIELILSDVKAVSYVHVPRRKLYRWSRSAVGVMVFILLLLPVFAQIDVGQNEINVLNSDLAKISKPEARIIRIDRSLGNLILRSGSYSPSLEGILGMRARECGKIRRGDCSLDPAVAQMMCSEKFRQMPYFEAAWNGLFLGQPSQSTARVWQKLLNNCQSNASAAPVLAGLIYLRNWLKSGNVGEAVDFFAWLSEKFEKMGERDKKLVHSSVASFFPGGPAPLPNAAAPASLVSILPIALLVRFHNYLDYDIVVSHKTFLKKVVDTIATASGVVRTKVLAFLVDLGFTNEAIAFYKKNEKFLTDKWDTYNLCVLHKVTGRYDSALGCVTPLRNDMWFEYEIFDVNYLKGNTAEAEKSLERMKNWSSPYTVLAKASLRKQLDAEDVEKIRKNIEKDYIFGFLILSHPLDKLGVGGEALSRLRSQYFKKYKDRFFVVNFNNKNKLVEIAKALGPLHNVSRGVRQKYPEEFPHKK